MNKKILKQKPERSEEVQKWIDAEVKEQIERYTQIAKEMNIDLTETREQWYREFEERIQTTGFNVHADIKKIIKPEEIYLKPDGEHKVVY